MKSIIVEFLVNNPVIIIKVILQIIVKIIELIIKYKIAKNTSKVED